MFHSSNSALDIGLGNVPLNNDDYLKKYNKNTPLIAPKVSPFDNFTTSFQDSFILTNEDFFQSTNEHHIYLHSRNANWLAREIDSVVNNNETFDCSFMCSDNQITGNSSICIAETYSISGTTPVTWSISPSNFATLSTSGNQVTVTPSLGAGQTTLTATISTGCGTKQIQKQISAGIPDHSISVLEYQGILPVSVCYAYTNYSFEAKAIAPNGVYPYYPYEFASTELLFFLLLEKSLKNSLKV